VTASLSKEEDGLASHLEYDKDHKVYLHLVFALQIYQKADHNYF